MAAKWNGKSLYQLRLREGRVKNLDAMMGELRTLRDGADEAFLEELGKIIGKDWDALKEGPWPCEGSPVGHCVYDMSSDEMDDECLFCHEPCERK